VEQEPAADPALADQATILLLQAGSFSAGELPAHHHGAAGAAGREPAGGDRRRRHARADRLIAVPRGAPGAP
jgi:hypothetical protein